MSSFSVDGLISGLDTTSLINSLMQAERQPQVNLQTKKTSIQSSVDVYRGLNTKLQAIESAAADLASPTGWKAAAGVSSDETVATVSVGLNATPVALAFHVTALAAAHAVVSGGTNVDPAATGQITGPVTLTGASGTTTISSVGDGSLNAVASAINVSTANVTATVVHLADGSYALQLASRSTGAASQFTVGGLDALGTFGVLSQGADAKLTVGDPLGTHYDVTSATNTFTGLSSGVSITAKKIGDASVSVTSDPSAIADKVDAMVKAINDALSSISAQSAYNGTTKTAGALLGDLSATRLSQSLTSAVIGGVGSTGTSGATAGISIQRDGTVAFDRQKFLDAYQADPTAVAKVLQANDPVDTTDDGLAERLRVVAHNATDTVSGTITLAIQSRTDEMKQLDDAISSWDSRLSTKQDALKAMFSNMEVALSQLKSQSNWLAGQIARL